MYTNIYEALRSGRTAEDLVKDFTDAMNEAEDRVRREDEEARAAEEQARLAAEAAKLAEDNKVAEFAAVLRPFVEVMQKYYPQLGLEIGEEEEYEAAAALIVSLLDLESLKFQIKTPIAKKKTVSKRAKSADDVFADFFKSLGF